MHTLLTIALAWLALTLCVGLLIGRAMRRAGQEPADAVLDEAVLDDAVLDDAVLDDAVLVEPAAVEDPTRTARIDEPAHDHPQPAIPAARVPLAEEEPLPTTGATLSGQVPKIA